MTAADDVTQPRCSHSGLPGVLALGHLDADAEAALREHLADGCVACAQELHEARDAVAALDLTAPALEPPASARARLLAAIAPRGADPTPDPDDDDGLRPWRRWSASGAREALPGLHTQHGDAHQGWEASSQPGVHVRPLHVDEARRMVTMLVRMEAGSSYPPHRHAAAEECFVLEGDLRVGDEIEMSAGDYQQADAGSIHPVQSTEEGCLLLIVSSQDDELL